MKIEFKQCSACSRWYVPVSAPFDDGECSACEKVGAEPSNEPAWVWVDGDPLRGVIRADISIERTHSTSARPSVAVEQAQAVAEAERILGLRK